MDSTKIAATVSQREILVASLDHYATHGRWPTARELADIVDYTFPGICRELKSLARLALVSWGKTVRVLRMPDGLFFCPSNEQAFTYEMSRECAPQTEATQ